MPLPDRREACEGRNSVRKPGRQRQTGGLAAVSSNLLFGFRSQGKRSRDPAGFVSGFFRFRDRLPNTLTGQRGSRSVRLRLETIRFPRSMPRLRCGCGSPPGAICYEVLSSGTIPTGGRAAHQAGIAIISYPPTSRRLRRIPRCSPGCYPGQPAQTLRAALPDLGEALSTINIF